MDKKFLPRTFIGIFVFTKLELKLNHVSKSPSMQNLAVQQNECLVLNIQEFQC